MSQSTLEVQKRERVGKSASKQVRRAGLIPGIVYGRSTEPIPISVDPKNLKKALDTPSRENTLLELKIQSSEGEIKKLALLKDVQFNHLTSEPIHFDFQQVELEQKITVKVPIEVVGRAWGVQEGGILEEILREIEIECLPGSIPNRITVDVTELGLGKSIHVEDLKLPPGVSPLNDPKETVLTIVAPSVEEAALTEEAEEET
jgi:large subunit ribosomal protein L25